MRMLISSVVLLLLSAGALAEEKKGEAPKVPEAMPVQAAQDLDYALLRRAAKRKEIYDEMNKDFVKKFEEAAKKATQKWDEQIKLAESKYKLRLFDEHGMQVDHFDPDSGKITRAK